VTLAQDEGDSGLDTDKVLSDGEWGKRRIEQEALAYLARCRLIPESREKSPEPHDDEPIGYPTSLLLLLIMPGVTTSID